VRIVFEERARTSWTAKSPSEMGKMFQILKTLINTWFFVDIDIIIINKLSELCYLEVTLMGGFPEM